MCFHVQLPEKIVWATALDEDYQLIDEYDKAYHLVGFNHPDLPVIKQETPKTVQAIQWGLIPHWAQNLEKATELQNFTLNATCENIFDKPSFRDSVYKKRCLVLVSGFYENRHEGKLKYPYFIYPAKQKIFLLGGLTSEWVNRETGEIVETCTIITTPANPLMEKIHNTKKRMPLIFTEEQAKRWLTPLLTKEEIQGLTTPCNEEMLQSHTVSRLINQFQQRDSNVETISAPVTYPELALLDA